MFWWWASAFCTEPMRSLSTCSGRGSGVLRLRKFTRVYSSINHSCLLNWTTSPCMLFGKVCQTSSHNIRWLHKNKRWGFAGTSSSVCIIALQAGLPTRIPNMGQYGNTHHTAFGGGNTLSLNLSGYVDQEGLQSEMKLRQAETLNKEPDCGWTWGEQQITHEANRRDVTLNVIYI